MTRIVSGIAGGRNLRVPKSGTRPTSERVREALFSRLDHFGYIRDCVVLDLYAGSGALGLEALSRGAKRVVCVEAASAASKVIVENARLTGLNVEVQNQKAETYLASQGLPTFDLILIDPPYALSEDDLALVLGLAVMHLAEDGMLVVERDKKSPEPQWPAGYHLDDDRKWGDTRVWSAIRSEIGHNIEI
ncbi:16S rRNA (guanine(966)-N(2))-methyltransferase RsmD [Arcanobacterium pluranimalium]|uniref:16S rRNA (guanine(966)-N(2))-methyltransferase RsmD n=1 Tax=Arcanobacterium pluranimalium TaxID=108028 RepID=UPI00195B4D10|nr:16S rRNA (guanine(966)-N(2))-methyltransferase RsmD [Arcanobacterium pluranimalium]